MPPKPRLISINGQQTENGKRFYHKPTGYNTDPRHDRMVYYGDESLTRLIQRQPPNGAWGYDLSFIGLDARVYSINLNEALTTIKHLYLHCRS